MTTPVVSVVMPLWNVERFLEEAVASVFAQTRADWELLLVDDGSTDRSTALAREAASRDPERVHYLEHPGHENRGASAARNLAIRRASGRYVAFLDADDVWLPRKLERQVAMLDDRPEAALLYGRTQYWYSWTGRPEDRDRDKVIGLGCVRPGTVIEPPELLIRMLGHQIPVPCTCSILVRRDALEAIGGFEESFRFVFTDQALYAKLFLKTPALATHGCWDRYRRHPESSVSVAKRSGDIARAELAFLRWLRDYLVREGTQEREVMKALEERLARAEDGVRTPLQRAVRDPAGTLTRWAEHLATRTLPPALQDRLRRWWRGEDYLPPAGRVRLGDLQRLGPFSERWGLDRGRPVDRYYIESFLSRHAGDVRGHVLEIGDDAYTRAFGGAAVTRSDVLNVDDGEPGTTIVANLDGAAEELPAEQFDCIVFTQTLHLLYEAKRAVGILRRSLKPRGVLLATAPGISPIGRSHQWGDRWYWSFTAVSAARLFGEVFGPASVRVESMGNVLAAAAFLYGLSDAELSKEELEHADPLFPVVIAIRAVK